MDGILKQKEPLRKKDPEGVCLIIGFSQLSDMEFFVDPKNEMSETEIHPLCGWE